jgi:hypothetical protein
MKTPIVASLALVATLMLPMAAHADGLAYMGTDLGGASYNFDSTHNYNTGGGTYRFFAGWQFSPHFSLEASYTDFGTQTDYFDFGAPGGGAFTQDLEGKGFGLAANISEYISDYWSVYGRLGAMDVRLRIHQDDFSGNTFDATTAGWRGMFGMGMAYDFTQNFSLRFGLDSYQNLGDSSTTGHGNITLGYVGAVLYF